MYFFLLFPEGGRHGHQNTQDSNLSHFYFNAYYKYASYNFELRDSLEDAPTD